MRFDFIVLSNENYNHLIVSLQMEIGDVPYRSVDISVNIGPQYVMDCYGTDQKAIRYDEITM